MKVKECPECGGYVPVDWGQCQNCGHKFWSNEKVKPAATARARTGRQDKVVWDKSVPFLRRRVPMFWRIVVVILVIIFAIVLNFLLLT